MKMSNPLGPYSGPFGGVIDPATVYYGKIKPLLRDLTNFFSNYPDRNFKEEEYLQRVGYEQAQRELDWQLKFNRGLTSTALITASFLSYRFDFPKIEDPGGLNRSQIAHLAYGFFFPSLLKSSVEIFNIISLENPDSPMRMSDYKELIKAREIRAGVITFLAYIGMEGLEFVSGSRTDIDDLLDITAAVAGGSMNFSMDLFTYRRLLRNAHRNEKS